MESQPLSPEVAAQNKGPAILATIYTVTVLSTSFTAARVFVRTKILGKLQLDDYLIVLSVVWLYSCDELWMADCE